MNIQNIQVLMGRSSKAKALGRLLRDQNRKEIRLEGLQASSAPLYFASLAVKCAEALTHPYLFVLDDEEQAGYFYHDLTQILGQAGVHFLPSSFRRAVKYGQRDAGNEILRTDALSALQRGGHGLFVVTYPEAMAETVVDKERLTQNTVRLQVGGTQDIRQLQSTLLDLGFRRTDYVYEPGQFAVRGSLVDVYSFSCENPYRIDFFGDEIDSIRTFDVQSQLSVEKLSDISIVPEMGGSESGRICLLDFLPAETQIVMRDRVFLCDQVQRVWDEGFSLAARIVEEAEEGTKNGELKNEAQPIVHCTLSIVHWLTPPDHFRHRLLDFRTVVLGASRTGKADLTFDIAPQPVFHKNFDLLTRELLRLHHEGYSLYILADSTKQTDRLKAIFHDMSLGIDFTPIDRTLHGGFIDHEQHMVFFTDHQIFDRFHKYNLRSEHARKGKMALTLKEIQQFQLGDYVVHIDHGIGRFGGLINIPEGARRVEQIRSNYDGGGVIYGSIHALHKVSKYKGQEGTPPKVNKLGGRAWENLKERTKSKLKDIARDLIRLYSLRRQEKGFQFSPDSYLQHELEASFIYEDTPDQLKATQEVKADMERQRPMDRVVCGDVRFGKT